MTIEERKQRILDKIAQMQAEGQDMQDALNILEVKPDAEVVNYILKKAGVSREESIFVGDSPTDLKTARNAGIDSVAVTWGFRPREVLLDATHLVSSPKELRELLLSLI